MWIPLVCVCCVSGVVSGKWLSRQANDAVASKQSILNENHGYIVKGCPCVVVNMYLPIFQGRV